MNAMSPGTSSISARSAGPPHRASYSRRGPGVVMPGPADRVRRRWSRRVSRSDERARETRAVRGHPAATDVTGVAGPELGREGPWTADRRRRQQLERTIVGQAVRSDERLVAEALARDIDDDAWVRCACRSGRPGERERQTESGGQHER